MVSVRIRVSVRVSLGIGLGSLVLIGSPYPRQVVFRQDDFPTGLFPDVCLMNYNSSTRACQKFETYKV